MPTRKELLKLFASLPLAGSLAGTSLFRKKADDHVDLSNYQRDYITELGLRKFINGRGTITTLSGSLMPPEVVQAISSSSEHFVDLIDLNRKVGERIAEMLRCEDAHVTAGAASAMQLATAACLTGLDREKMRQIPHFPDPKPEVILQKTHRMGFDQMITNCGVRFVEVEGADEMEQSINENTVMAFFFNAASEHSISHEEFVRIGKEHGVPTFNDAAADVPPVENLFKYIEMGFDLVCFSGGKAIRGPQSAGLLFGRKDLIEAARLNHSPYGSTGRGMKVNKEEVIGMMVALEIYLEKDHDAERRVWESWVEEIASAARRVPSVETEMYVPEVANQVPHLRIRWDENIVGITPNRLREQLREGHPSIETFGSPETLEMNVFMMKPEEVGIVARRVRQLLEQAV